MAAEFKYPGQVILTPEQKRWNVFYPVYINSQKKISEGRKMPMKYCVPKPLSSEMEEIAKFLKLEVIHEPLKAYSRDATMRGRIRVQLKGPDGKPVHPEIKSRKQFLMMCGQKILLLKSRQTKGGAKAGETETAPAAATGKKAKKKGKK